MLSRVKGRWPLVLFPLVVGGGLLVGWQLYVRWIADRTPNWDGVPIPADGLRLRVDNWDKPGNPEYAVEDLKRTYAALDAFRRRTGRLPELRELLNWDGRHPGPGKLEREDWTTPDMHLAPGIAPQENSVYAYNYRAKRPDGQEKPAFPRKGERDVWAYSDAYVRYRQTVYRDRPESMQPSGTFVVLWSDGTVEKVPPSRLILYEESPGTFGKAFPGQTGIPPKSTTWESFLKKHGVEFKGN